MNKKYKIAVLFGSGHGLNDFIAGFLLANLSTTSSNWQLNTMAFLVYSILAFGGQLPAGMLLDKVKKLKLFSLVSLLLMFLAIVVFFVNIYAAILLSGIASALIHICGGTACYLSDNKDSALAGIFTSPGVVGLIAGGILGAVYINYFYLLLIPVLLLLVWMISLEFPIYSVIKENKEAPMLDTHDFFMLILLSAIAFRSLLWNVLHMMCFNDTEWLLGIAFSAGAGKLIGGYITHKVDWKKFVFVSMVCSVLLLNIGKNYFPVFCIGVALLQSAVPITLLLMQNYLQYSPATASGLSLGVAIILAGLPTYFEQFRQIQNSRGFLILLSIAFLISNLWILSKARRKFSKH